MKTTKNLIMLLSAIGIFALTSCNNNERRDSNNQMGSDSIRMAEENRMNQERMDMQNNSVHALVQQDTVLTTFSRNIESNQLAQTFREEEGPYTVFAPSNVAYNNLSQEERNNLMNGQNMNENSARLFYLVVDEELTSEELREEIQNTDDGTYELSTMQGEEIVATLEGDEVVLTDGSGNRATLTSSDIDASNGVIHVIDGILEPSDASTNAADIPRSNQMQENNQNNGLNNSGTMNNNRNVDGTGDRSNTGNTDNSDIQPGSQNTGNSSNRSDIDQ